MTYFNDDIMKHILGYCGRTIEEERDYLWKHISIDREECRFDDDDELPYCITYDGIEKKEIKRCRCNKCRFKKSYRKKYTRIIEYINSDLLEVANLRLTAINLTNAMESWRLTNDISNKCGRPQDIQGYL